MDDKRREKYQYHKALTVGEMEHEDDLKSPLLSSWRLWTAILVMLGSAHLVVCRMSLSMALVCMVKYDYKGVASIGEVTTTSHDVFDNSSSRPDTGNFTSGNFVVKEKLHPCASPGQDEFKQDNLGTFSWNKEIQGHLLSGYFYGFCPGQILGGLACDRWGGRRIMILGVGLSAILTLLHPLCANLHPWALFAVRALTGFIGGFGLSCPPYLLSRWGSPADLSLLLGIAYTGFSFGTMVTHPLVSNMCLFGPFGGWPSAFYTIGVAGVIWIIISFFLLHNKPAAHPFISLKELRYLNVEEKDLEEKVSPRTTPWGKIFTSRPIWIAFLSSLFCTFGYFTLVLHQPLFMRDIFAFPTQQNGLVSSLPWIMEVPVSIAAGSAVDFLKKTRLSITAIRKLFNTVGFSIAVVVLVVVVEVDCHLRWIAGIALTLAEMGNCLAFVGGNFYIAVDLAPAYSSTVFGFLTFSMAVNGLVAPIVVSYLTPTGSRDEWRTVFWVASITVLVGIVIFLVWGTAESLPWGTLNNAHMPVAKDDDSLSPNGIRMEFLEELKSRSQDDIKDKEQENGDIATIYNCNNKRKENCNKDGCQTNQEYF